MNKILVIVDMQNDFIDGALGTNESKVIVPKVVEKINSFDKDGKIFLTLDTHLDNYLETQEGKNLPVEHCILDSKGWEINDSIRECLKDRKAVKLKKPTFGSSTLGFLLLHDYVEEQIDQVEIVGLCTDICVISNALLIKAFLPETEIIVDASCCAGVTPESHKNALEAMKMCQIKIINE